MEDIDMELPPALAARVRELSAGSSRPEGNPDGGPTVTGGARGCGGA